MLQPKPRYVAPNPPQLASGWRYERLTPASYLAGSNGMRTGADGRIYIAQVTSSTISALDINTGEIETISPLGGDIVGPDDLVFDPEGNLYVTEVMDGRVSMLTPDGRARVLRDDLPSANGITYYQNRLYVNECRVGGRLMEIDRQGGAPRVLLGDIAMGNGMAPGPDGKIYFPVMGLNEIWRISPEGGTPEKVVGDLGVPDAVKFDSKGFIISTQVHTGEVLRIDPQTGARELLASLNPGLDNVTFVGDRIFVSHLNEGRITEILGGGATKPLLQGGLMWPLGLAMGEDGRIFVADGCASYWLVPGGALQFCGMLFAPGYPGFVRGVAAEGNGAFIVTTANGEVFRFWPDKYENMMLASGLNQLYGVAIAPGGGIIVAELGAGRVLSIAAGNTPEAVIDVLATGLRDPLGVAIDTDGSCLVSESAGGRVIKINGTKVETVLDGLQFPQGILVRDGQLYVVDAGAKTVIAYDLARETQQIIAAKLPIGAPPGVVSKPLRGLQPFSGPQGPFAGITAGTDGTLYVGADTEGSVIALRPAG
jgi:sugar lactone lactonase YvrE